MNTKDINYFIEHIALDLSRSIRNWEHKMKQVTKDEFWSYFQNKNYIKRQGDAFHSEYFIVDSEVVGYMETSSYGAPTVYKLKYGTVNSEAISLVGSIISAKTK